MSRPCDCVGSYVAAFFAAVTALFVLAISTPGVCAEGASHPPKKILIVYSFDNDEAIYSGFDHVLRERIRMRLPQRVEFYTEYLDLVRFPTASHAEDMVKLLRLKYSQQKPDLIIPVSYSALQFLVDHRKDLFSGTPMVALFNQRKLDDLKQRLARSPGENITGVTSTDEPARTVDLALRLQPDTQHVAVVVGSSSLENYWRDQLRQDLSPYSGRVELIYLTGISLDELLKRVAALPAHSIILSTFFFQDATGQFFIPEEVLDHISREARVPIYTIYSSYIGHGVVGGWMTNPEISGRRVADLALAVLKGEKADGIPIVADNAAANMVDWRQLQRWGISEKRLPPSTLELFREATLWERYRTLVLGMIALCAVEFVLVFALVFNIRQRRRAEKELLREKTLADAVIESLPGVFLVQDEAGRNLRWNKNAATLPRFPLAGAMFPSNVADTHKQSAIEARQRVLEDGAGEVEVDLLLQNGKTGPFYFTGKRVELEGKPYITAIGIDLTERKKAEEAVRRFEAEMRLLVEHAPYGIGTINVEQDRFVHANPAMVKLLGYTSEAEVLALNVSRDLYCDGEAQGFRAQPTRADFFSAVEFNWRRKDGKPVIVRASGRRVRTTGDQGDLTEIIAEDVTARRSLEEQLRQAQKLEALGQLSGSVAHDFNNLLSVIIGYSELLSINPIFEGALKAHLEAIRRAGERAASLTSQLLAFSRRQVLQPSVINLNLLIRETQRMLQRLMREDIEHRVVLDPGLWKAKADPNQLVQVIMNLSINARDAMPRGGTLTIATANVTFHGVMTIKGVDVPAGNYVKLTVTDTGIGMDEETQARIFEPFFTTKEAGKGTGLGLATVYGIVKQSGGYIFSDSEVGNGTTLSIYLPQFERAHEAASATTGSGDSKFGSAQHGSETILVVEDEAAFRDLLRDGLRAKGYDVLVAANGVEALRVAEQDGISIRLLITDVIMPQMSGPELARALRATHDIPVLYMSGYTDDKLRDMSDSGELALMRKPFYIEELVERMTEMLAHAKVDAKRKVSPVVQP